MRFYYLFLAISLFAQTPEAERLTTVLTQEINREHGSVIIVQGRHDVEVKVLSRGAFTFELLRLNGERVITGESRESSDVFTYSKSSLGTGGYMAHAVFADGTEVWEFFILN